MQDHNTDNKGHPMIKTVGIVAGDEESYDVFKDLFDPVIAIRHNGYSADATHPTDLELSKLSNTVIDPTQRIVLSTRVRASRSFRGFRLPPSCSKEERRKVEALATKALISMEGSLKGEYYPLATSTSYAGKPSGMSTAEEEKLRAEHFLFEAPDSKLLLASGMGRHWPDARGIFVNDDKNLIVWCNEEDHIRITSMQMGSDMTSTFQRFVECTEHMKGVISGEHGQGFMHNEHLGFLVACPSNIGTGLRASMMMQLPLLSKHEKWKAICRKRKLQARGEQGADAKGGCVFDISNMDRLGLSEVDSMNNMIEGCTQLVQMEAQLESGAELPEEP